MKLDFVKLHGLGNDFVVVDNMDGTINLSAEQVIHLCDRHFGIGADGVILVEPPQNAASGSCVFMHYYNSDGSIAQMCGNGIRCCAKFLVDNKYVSVDDSPIQIDTLAGTKIIGFTVDNDGNLTEATVNMGQPILDPEKIPVDYAANAQSDEGVPYVRDMPIDSPWGHFEFTCVSMGNPHAVCFLDNLDALSDELFYDADDRDLANLNILFIGAFVESYKLFPEKTNVEFACIYDNGIAMRVFERGCGETLACGTGACATNVAAALTGRSCRENDVFLRGGTLHILWDEKGEVMMTGAARKAFAGSVEV